MIPLIQKASNVCAHCRIRKQRCDRMLPRCQRCAVKNQDCDYALPVQFGLPGAEPLVCRRPCGHADLSSYGATELVQAVKACIDAPHHPDPATDLMGLVSDVLSAIGFNLAHAFTEFGPCIQQWCPIIVQDHLLSNCDYKVTEPVSTQEGPKDPILWLSLWLVLRKPCSPAEQMGTSELYTMLKQVHALLQSAPKLELSVLQVGLILAVYEMGHGLRQQAFQTVGSCTATLQFLELNAAQPQNSELEGNLTWLKASVAMLDRQLPLSMTADCLPLTLSSRHAISLALRKTLGSGLPPMSTRQSATSPRKVFIRTGAAIAAGHALEYVYSRQHGSDPDQSYDHADAVVNRCISMLIVKPDSLFLLHCDAAPMTFCSHIILQSTHIQHLRNAGLCGQLPADPSPEYSKALIALDFSRSMSWEMVRIAVQLIKSEASISRMTLAGLCSVMRAGLAVLETRQLVDREYVIQQGELESYIRILKWFAARWQIGNEYLERLENIIGHL
ncbi:hypothetical protein DE146DRAFT_151443 [Phaeosphaeria sp. MPI-PUGE-AT-0046c]|nr:hypothetical protein DE146DRAFT_151443 [Phaeosphaeria sp. MPI-PUGE-AT-0046c]